MATGSRERIAVAMSGGVDSSTVAAWLVAQGHEVIGLSMQLWSQTAPGGTARGSCCAIDDRQDARRVAELLGIPFYVINLEEAFSSAVIADFIATYAAGKTPNPCVRCNQSLKFVHLLAKAQALEATALATGHYAVIRPTATGKPGLWRGRDPAKDQSYFLFATPLTQLANLHFPLGELTKEQTRALARQFGLHNAGKHESQDLCFVPDGDYQTFFKGHAPELLVEGEIIDLDGRVRGRHRGVGCYTIGQRHGLGIAAAYPLFVIAIDPSHRRLIVGPAEALYKDRLEVTDINWLVHRPPDARQPVAVKIRYAGVPQPAIIEPLGDPNRVVVRFAEPQRAVTPGQACVFYAADQVLGGGWIL
ncbi:MAG: tRNA 2-thiouridine(34) synthase MnmA [Magnetococcales bacterium]|nr:tRNA 2-thiouridine(34) synthase MnmA [Magnetococcales bacterium]